MLFLCGLLLVHSGWGRSDSSSSGRRGSGSSGRSLRLLGKEFNSLGYDRAQLALFVGLILLAGERPLLVIMSRSVLLRSGH